jgi:hypothetical protein
MKVTRQRSAMDLMNWKNFYAISPWKRTTPSSTYAAASAAHTNIKLLLTE